MRPRDFDRDRDFDFRFFGALRLRLRLLERDFFVRRVVDDDRRIVDLDVDLDLVRIVSAAATVFGRDDNLFLFIIGLTICFDFVIPASVILGPIISFEFGL